MTEDGRIQRLIDDKRRLIHQWEQARIADEQEHNQGKLPLAALNLRREEHERKIAEAQEEIARLEAELVSGKTASLYSGQAHVFISYARADALQLAERLYNDLLGAGYSVWRDERDLDPYRPFDSAIEAAIRSALAVVTLITPDVSRETSFVRREIAFALDVNTPIIPLKCPGGVMPITINLLTWVNFHDYDRGLRDLLARLRQPQQALTPEHRHERERAYLQDIGQRFEKWLYLYTELQGQAQQPRTEPAVAVKRHVLKYLNTENNVYVERGYVEEGETRRVETVDDLRKVVRQGGVVLIGDPGSGKTTTT